MTEIDVVEAPPALRAWLERVEQGGEVLITHEGRVVAKLVAPGAVPDTDQARQAALRLRARRAGASLGELTLRDLIDEGRR